MKADRCDPHDLANIALSMSLSISVETEVSRGNSGLQRPLTTGFIENGTLTPGGTSLPSFFIIAAVSAMRD